MIISGFGAQGGDISYKIVVGGGALVIPMLQQRVFLSLEVMTVEVPADAPVISSDGVAIYIAGTVQFRVGGDNLSIAMAAESLLRKSEEEIRNVVYNLMRNQMTATIQKAPLAKSAKIPVRSSPRCRKGCGNNWANSACAFCLLPLNSIFRSPSAPFPSQRIS